MALIKKRQIQNFKFQPKAPVLSTVPVVTEEMIAGDKQKLLIEFESKLEKQRSEVEAQINSQLEQAQIEAQKIIDLAQQNKVDLDNFINEEKAKLQAEREEIEKLAIAEKEKAFNEAMLEAESIKDQMAEILGAFQNVKYKILEEAKDEIASLALDVAKNILSYEARIDQKALFHLVKNSIEKVASTEKGRLIVSLNPSDLEHKEELSKNLEAVLDLGVRLIFQKDESVPLGSCILETQGGRFDARFTTQIEIIKLAFSKFLGKKLVDFSPDNLQDLFPLDDPEDFPDEPSDEELQALDKNIAAIYADIASEEDLRSLLSEINKEEEEKNFPKMGKKTKEAQVMDFDTHKIDEIIGEEAIMGLEDSLVYEKVEDDDEELIEDDYEVQYEKDFDDLEEEEEEKELEEEDIEDSDSPSVESKEDYSFEEFKEDDFEEGFDEDQGMSDPRFPEY